MTTHSLARACPFISLACALRRRARCPDEMKPAYDLVIARLRDDANALIAARNN